MKKINRYAACMALLILGICATVFAQEPGAAEKSVVKVQVVISRYNGDRKVSSLPYTIMAKVGNQVSMLNGMNVPISGANGNAQYTNVGTTITCTVTSEGGRFKVNLLVDDKNVVDTKSAQPGASAKPLEAPSLAKPLESPSFSDFSYQGVIGIEDGQTKQVTTAADKVTGEVIKIDLTLNLDK